MFSYSLNNTTTLSHFSYEWEDDASIIRLFFSFSFFASPKCVILKRESSTTIAMRSRWRHVVPLECEAQVLVCLMWACVPCGTCFEWNPNQPQCVQCIAATSPTHSWQDLVSGDILGYGVEAPATDHLRDSTLDLEKYEAVQIFPV